MKENFIDSVQEFVTNFDEHKKEYATLKNGLEVLELVEKIENSLSLRGRARSEYVNALKHEASNHILKVITTIVDPINEDDDL